MANKNQALHVWRGEAMWVGHVEVLRQYKVKNFAWN